MWRLQYCLKEKEKRGAYHQKVQAYTYSKVVNTAKKQGIMKFREYLKHISWRAATVVEERLGSGKRREMVVEMLRTSANIWTLPFLRITSVSVNLKWFWMHVAD